jgi:hypothetical protein
MPLSVRSRFQWPHRSFGYVAAAPYNTPDDYDRLAATSGNYWTGVPDGMVPLVVGGRAG